MLLLSLLATAAACRRAGPEPRTWDIRVSAGGVPVSSLVTEFTGFGVVGQGARQADGSYLITQATRTDLETPAPIGDVLIEFDAHSGVSFPDLTGTVSASVLVDPAHLGPGRELLPVVGLLLWQGETAELRPRFFLHESTILGSDARVATIFNVEAAGPTGGGAPEFALIEQWIEYEPDECGIVYYDDLGAFGQSSSVTLRRGERDTLVTVEPQAEGDPTVRWVVRHEESWHRDGACSYQSRAYTQLAAWYAGP